MKFVSDNDASRRITPRRYRCVWMDAGILSYLLCDREFDCERCPLDEAMRSHYSPLSKHGETPQTIGDDTPGTGPGAWAGSTDDHVSVTVREDGTLRVSLEPAVAELLPSVRSVVLPVPGRKITSGCLCCWFIFEGGTLPIRIPFQGRVTGVNRKLADHPHLVTTSSDGEGWLFDVRPSDRTGALRSLLSPEEAQALSDQDREIFHRLIAECVRPPSLGTGVTMQDGGSPVEDLPAVIGPVKYLEIVRRAFWGKR